MDADEGFVPILGIFYAIFHPTEGTKIVHQVPEGSITSFSSATIVDPANVLFNFDTVKNYIIPKPQLCNKFVSFKVNRFKVLGYPVNIESARYSRNSFSFNFGFVFPYNSDVTPYESAIRRMGKMFRVLEEQSFLLSKLGEDQLLVSDPDKESDSARLRYAPGHEKFRKFSLSSIGSLIHQIYQDLNNYSECCIPIDSANSVDIKLFPILPPPVNLKAFQVPILQVKLHSLIDVNWDPTMVKILPYINGLNSVKRISELADADYLLTKQCIQHLMHYQCITMVDIFQFSNIYAPTNNIGDFLKPNGMAEDCQAYVISTSDWSASSSNPLTPRTPVTPLTPGLLGKSVKDSENSDSANSSYFVHKNIASSTSPLTKNSLGRSGPGGTVWRQTIHVPSKATLFYLYRSLNQGQTIKEWYIQHQKALKNIDVRRFINFGVVRGITYRVHSYPILHSVTKSLENGDEKVSDLDELVTQYERKMEINKRRTQSNATDPREAGLLKTTINETNLKTGKKTRTVSFNYNVDRYSRDSDEDVDESVFVSDSESSTSGVSDSDAGVAIADVGESDSDDDSDEKADLVKLSKLVRGVQHTDCICTELQKSRIEVESLLDRLGPHFIINS
ncbi:Nitrogen permease regulator 2 family protein [Clavispora lusitaniae]|uniref:Nitrogen permease regulator 2 family protein n=1 Tax=Clavispora lusitaniae TaxID=36911 RepID=UPI00202C731E|nr:Nitrogen permease regulator 2 family protein [Clavispora lusitaniae]